MKQILVPLVLLLGICYHTVAQDQDASNPQVSLGVGYFGELFTHPGISLFGEVDLPEISWLVRSSLVYYRHAGHTHNGLLLPELAWRKQVFRQSFMEVSAGAGVLFQRPDAPVWAYAEDGSFQEVAGWRAYFSPAIGARIGRSLSLSGGQELLPSLGGRLFSLYPFNDMWLMRGAIDISLSVKISKP